MTYEKAKHWFWRFKGIKSANEVNGRLSMKQYNDLETWAALKYYMAELGCIAKWGKFYQWWEVDLKTGEAVPAKINIEGYISPRSIIRQPCKVYVEGYDERWALINAKELSRSRTNVE